MVVREHHYKPDPIFKGFKSKSTWSGAFGVELEVEKFIHDEPSVEDTLFSSDFYLKYDGSLCNGFEIVTEPCTLDYHRSTFEWKRLLEVLQDAGCKSHDTLTCGLHIHISRDSFGENSAFPEAESIKHFVNFIFEQQEYMKVLARRSDPQWAEYNSSYEYQEKAFSGRGDRDGCRYRAVNLCNRKTVELRIFRGTLKYETLLATIELTHALFKWSKNKNFTYKWSDFMRFLGTRRYKYTYIFNYIFDKIYGINCTDES